MRLGYTSIATRVKPWQALRQQHFLKKILCPNRTLPPSSIMDPSARDLHKPANWSVSKYMLDELGLERGPKYMQDNLSVESLEQYGAGGYHPTHLGDKLSGGRYEVIYKLGHGDYSTIWLCRDFQEQRYVSVKIAASEIPGGQRQKDNQREIYHALRIGDPEHPGKKFVTSLLDDFSLEGPNGCHQCFVFPVALNSVAIAKELNDSHFFPTKVARSIVTQSLLALSYIHSCGIVHADLHTGNILIKAPSINSWPLPEPYEQPEKFPVERYDGAPIGNDVPKYQISPTHSLTPSDTIDSDCQVMIIGFGKAYFREGSGGVSQKMELQTPMLVRPLDTVLGLPITSAVDIWTMGMTIFDIMGRSNLLNHDWPDEDSTILSAVSILGPLPSKMLQAWPNHSKSFKEDGSWLEDQKPLASRSLTTRLRECMQNESRFKTFGHGDAELQSLEKLLCSMLQYEPNNRINVNQALSSQWVQDYGIPGLLKCVPDVNLSSVENRPARSCWQGWGSFFSA